MRRIRFLPAAGLLALLVLVAAMLDRRQEEVVAGRARVIDGDSLVINGREMRLRGLDAPEFRQTCTIANRSVPCGREARAALQAWVSRGVPACIGRETDRYGRLLVTCRVNGADIGADLVRRGLAVDFGGYADEEREARAAFRGIWSGEFERPADYRRRMQQEREATRRGP